MKLAKDLKEFVELLNSTGVEYLIVGGYAVAFHGHPRYTGDIDVLVRRSPANADRIVRVLESFGFGSVGVDAQTFLTPETVVQLGRPPNRIDILTDISAVDFDSAWAAREDAKLDGVPVSMIGRRDLITNKRASGRPLDLADVDALGDGD